jgi:hypothetical protein
LDTLDKFKDNTLFVLISDTSYRAERSVHRGELDQDRIVAWTDWEVSRGNLEAKAGV